MSRFFWVAGIAAAVYLGRWARNLTILLAAERAYAANRRLMPPFMAPGDDMIDTPSRGLSPEGDW